VFNPLPLIRIQIEKLEYNERWNWLYWPLKQVFMFCGMFLILVVLVGFVSLIVSVINWKLPRIESIITGLELITFLCVAAIVYGWFEHLSEKDKETLWSYAPYAIGFAGIVYIISLHGDYEDARTESDALKSELLKFESDSTISKKIEAYKNDSIPEDSDVYENDYH
jgi:hypothetical protein